jgi:hypothetical protein
VLLLPMLAVPKPAAALCGERDPDPIPAYGTPVVFVGTAVETRSDNYSALFHVKEVWLGGPLPEWQPVIGHLPETPFMWIEDAVQWKVGVEYLVVTYRQGVMLVGASMCGSGNTKYSADLAAYRPGNVSSPFPADRPLLWAPRHWVAQFWVLLLVPAVLLMLLAAAGVWLWRRPRRHVDSRRGPR